MARRHVPGLILAVLCAGSARAEAPAVTALPFDRLAHDAEAARVAGRLDEAASLYRRALAARPRWAEGLWALGTIAYEQDRLLECRDALLRLVRVKPQMAPAWAVRGLCEYHEGALAAAQAHIEKGLALGLDPKEDLGRVALYHYALLLVRAGEFEPAIAPLRTVLQFQAATPDLEAACGLVLLRRAESPARVPPAEREIVSQAGAAYCAHLARHAEDAVRRFDALVSRHPDQRYLRYGWGLALAQLGSPQALDLFRKEIELFPGDVLARVELGFGLLARGRDDEAVAPAQEATRLAPGLFATHLVLGRALAGVGDLAEGIRELETAAQMAPRIPEVQLALARAYAQAGRGADAARARAAFQSLEAARRAPSGETPRPTEAP